MRRDRFILSTAARGAALLVVPTPFAVAASNEAASANDDSRAASNGPFRAIERKWGVTVGVAAHVVGTHWALEHRARERFPLASTWKVPLVMTVLAGAEAGKLSLDQAVAFTRADFESYSTIAHDYPHGGKLSVREICRRTISHSDNTGADLLVPLVGGPAGVNRYLRTIGIAGASIDHRERELPSAAVRADPHDTATPQAMMRLVERLVTRSPLAPAGTRMLLGWMRATTTGDARLRAGVPSGWTVADKTGTYANAFNDIGLLYPPSGRPIAVACYTFGQARDGAGEKAVADCARAVVRALR